MTLRTRMTVAAANGDLRGWLRRTLGLLAPARWESLDQKPLGPAGTLMDVRMVVNEIGSVG
ncbi:MAG: hypothetical protein M3303_08675 [Gemmatimonadota bacterium]|nr:hypothetical protein [Gemmatimonadota bacterium]